VPEHFLGPLYNKIPEDMQLKAMFSGKTRYYISIIPNPINTGLPPSDAAIAAVCETDMGFYWGRLFGVRET